MAAGLCPGAGGCPGGTYLTGMYLGKAGVRSPYGAGGSLIVVIVWVYYVFDDFLFRDCVHSRAEFRAGCKTACSCAGLTSLQAKLPR